MALPALSPLLFQRQLARFPRCLHRPRRQQWGRWKDGKLNLIAEPQNQQDDSRGWVLPEMGCKAHFLSFGDGFVCGSGRAAGCRSDSTLSSRRRAFALPKPDQLDAFIRSGNLSLGSGKQRSSRMQVMAPHASAECGAVVTIPCGWAVAVRLQRKVSHRQFIPPHSKCPPQSHCPSVLPLVGCGQVWGVRRWTSRGWPAQC